MPKTSDDLFGVTAMRVRLAAFVIAAGVSSSGAALAQDICSNIRLSVSEQIECRGRITNSLGEGDRTRIQQEFEDRVRRANDQLITPRIMRSPALPTTSPLTSTAKPAVPPRPAAPEAPLLPGTTAPLAPLPSSPSGNISPTGESPVGRLVPNMTAPAPAASPVPPISPLPANPTASPPREAPIV